MLRGQGEMRKDVVEDQVEPLSRDTCSIRCTVNATEVSYVLESIWLNIVFYICLHYYHIHI